MPTITFTPANRSVEIEAGTSLLDAAALAGVSLTAPCGGQGVCGECRVRVTRGAVERVQRGALTPDELAAGWALACSGRVAGDATIEVVPADAAAVAQIVTRADGVETASHGAVAHTLARAEPPAAKHALHVPPLEPGQGACDYERLTGALRGAGGPETVATGLDVLRELAGMLRAQDGTVTLTIAEPLAGSAAEIVRIEPGDMTARQAGLAIDVGTTTCAVSLVDLVHNRLLGTAAEHNAQLARGADVISRINYSRTPERREELRQLVLGTLNRLIADLAAAHGWRPADIDNVALAGNTTMMHLLLGLDPEYIRLAPYTPTINQPPRLRARELGLDVYPLAPVVIAPSVGSYVGGDITAGLLRTALAEPGHDLRLFLDIGTNGEIVVGTGEWLMACAASAGPAFEGSGVRCGMRAARGAIERFALDATTGQPHVAVIGGQRPRGVCGSGMIDLLAELWRAELLDPSGKLHPERGGGRIRPAPGGTRNLDYTIVPAEASDNGEPITLDERDIQNLLRTKAAVYAAGALMLRSIGLDLDAVSQVYVAGGFGRYLDLQKSILIGLLPDLPVERFTYLGNSALAGAQMLLCSAAARARVFEVARRMTYLELNVDPAYMSEYTAALFLPHTDIERFPSVKAARQSSSATPGARS
jgi:uncharacterized 2Fe-2S/4Fe-4S cluster protein (DUF4445 family)